ncbi:MAG: hydrogenase 3 maturation endopeptidase HyCI [Candidatus Thermoplasmatota archaeon]|nr:hydrogenase 3 maturation endopeptidase HyCI [Candidatus Thermoplasmatota archaeon]
MTKLLLGVGNPLRGDDGIGPYIAELLQNMGGGWEAINAETVPENFTSTIRKKKPELLVLADASDMGLEPGEARIIPPEKVGVMHFSTHAIPLSVFIQIMGECAKKTYLLGIQVDLEKTAFGTELSPEAKEWAESVAHKLISLGVQTFQSL